MSHSPYPWQWCVVFYLVSWFASAIAIAWEPIVITTNQVQKVEDIARFDPRISPVQVKQIDGRLFENTIATVDEILEKHAGVTVRRSGGLGGFSTVSIRGSSSQQVLVMLDGLPINDASTGVVDLSHYSLDQFERIEVFKGNLPAEYGYGSIGGAINLITKKGSNQTSFSLGLGSFGAEKFSLYSSQKKATGFWQLTGNWLRSDNDFPVRRDAGTNLDTSDDFDDVRYNNQLKQKELSLTSSLKSQTRSLNLGLSFYDRNKNLPDISGREGVTSFLDTQRYIALLSYRHKFLNENILLEFKHEDRNEFYDDSQASIGNSVPAQIEFENQITTFRGYWEKFLGNQTWMVSSTASQSDFQSQNRLQRDVDCTISQRCEIYFERQKITFNLAWRWRKEKMTLESSASGLFLDDYNRSRGNQGFAVQKEKQQYGTYKLALKHKISTRWTQFWGLNHSVRLPNSYELYGDRGFQTGNTRLKAEEAVNAEWSLAYHHRKVDVKLSPYYRQVSDLIVPYVKGGSVITYDNINSADILGAELDIELPLSQSIRLRGNVNLMHSNTSSQNALFDDKKISGTYHHHYAFGFDYLVGAFKWSVNYLYADEFYFERSNIDKGNQKSSLDAFLAYRKGRIRLNAEVKNILNDRYFDFDEAPTPGRAYSFNLKYSW